MSATDKPLLDAPSLSPTGAQAAAVPPVSATAPSISAAPAAARTAEPISPTSSNSLVSDTELEAALAEIEKLCTSRPDESEPAASTVASGSDEDDLDPRSQPDDAPPLTPEAPAVADARTDADALQAP
ncbi:MAG: hypothetical protein HUU27_13250, partial [Phycisphaerae bacterium]|nr:hypothetical protein [Phycisphaerae bacterium]